MFASFCLELLDMEMLCFFLGVSLGVSGVQMLDGSNCSCAGQTSARFWLLTSQLVLAR